MPTSLNATNWVRVPAAKPLKVVEPDSAPATPVAGSARVWDNAAFAPGAGVSCPKFGVAAFPASALWLSGTPSLLASSAASHTTAVNVVLKLVPAATNTVLPAPVRPDGGS